ncbi:hypothetical protein ACJMK2_000877 [Sinanodonta woodiana]|uniref:P-loop containing nucleoside triphosphate hydrolase n=1 Tax=Sinanodonta woodiana TaxID=1069815 RepID=A0ABD3XSF7_SINWO
MDDRSIQLFKEALKDGKETVHSIRVMVVGHLGVGKTTLIKRLLGEEVNISERHPTEGIDVHVNCCDVSLSTHEWTRRIKDDKHYCQMELMFKKMLNSLSAHTTSKRYNPIRVLMSGGGYDVVYASLIPRLYNETLQLFYFFYCFAILLIFKDVRFNFVRGFLVGIHSSLCKLYVKFFFEDPTVGLI